MSRWLTGSKSRSRRRRSARTRILRIDELENRRLLHGSLLGGSLEEASEHDELEIEDRFEADERDDLPRAATLGRGAVVDSDEAEGEDDEWDDETEHWTYASPATALSSNQAPSNTVIAFRVGNEFWFGAVVVLDVRGTRDDDASAEEVTPAANIARTANGSDKTIAASTTRTTKDDLDEGESSAPETDVRTDRETRQSSGGDATVTNQSPGQTEPANLVAVTANPTDEKAGENLDQKDAVSPAALSNPITQGDGTFASAVEETQSLAPSRTKAGTSAETLEISNLKLGGPQRLPATAAERVPRDTWRHVETPPNLYQDPHARIFAALAPQSYDTAHWRLRDALSQDLAALETALQDLLADSGELGRDVAGWVLSSDVIDWTLTATIALVAGEIIRRKVRRSRSIDQSPSSDGMDGSLRLFPELVGLPTGTRP